jgi:hypothetical protein
MHWCIKELAHEVVNGTEWLVVTVDTIIDPKHPKYNQKAINAIRASALEAWTKENPATENVRLVQWNDRDAKGT